MKENATLKLMEECLITVGYALHGGDTERKGHSIAVAFSLEAIVEMSACDHLPQRLYSYEGWNFRLKIDVYDD